MGSNLKIIFLGTPEFAIPALEKLAQSEFRPDLVVCAPDKPSGRTQSLTSPQVKILAQKLGLKIFQTEKKEELEKLILAEKPGLIVCAAFSVILTEKTLAEPKFGCLNIHPSLLPHWRGASPIQSAILAGDKITGITIIKMIKKIDTGPIIAQKEILIGENKLSTPELSLILAREGANLLIEILPKWLNGEIETKNQDENEATFSKIIKKEDGKIDWSKSAKEIEQQIRAFFPWPGSFGFLAGQKIKIIKARAKEEGASKEIGEIFKDGDNNLCVQTKKGCLTIETLQSEGGKVLAASDFLRGHKEIIGQIFN